MISLDGKTVEQNKFSGNIGNIISKAKILHIVKDLQKS